MMFPFESIINNNSKKFSDLNFRNFLTIHVNVAHIFYNPTFTSKQYICFLNI